MATNKEDLLMAVFISAPVDEAVKEQFEKVCENRGVSPPDAIGIFIANAVANNGFLKKTTTPSKKRIRPPFQYDSMAGKIWMADDFNAPLDDFKEYME